MTEKLVGNMLGLISAEVTEATNVLQKAGLINYDAGEIMVLNRPGVEKRSCECYDVVKREMADSFHFQSKWVQWLRSPLAYRLSSAITRVASRVPSVA